MHMGTGVSARGGIEAALGVATRAGAETAGARTEPTRAGAETAGTGAGPETGTGRGRTRAVITLVITLIVALVVTRLRVLPVAGLRRLPVARSGAGRGALAEPRLRRRAPAWLRGRGCGCVGPGRSRGRLWLLSWHRVHVLGPLLTVPPSDVAFTIRVAVPAFFHKHHRDGAGQLGQERGQRQGRPFSRPGRTDGR